MDFLKAILLTVAMIIGMFTIMFVAPLIYVGYLKLKDKREEKKKKQKEDEKNGME